MGTCNSWTCGTEAGLQLGQSSFSFLVSNSLEVNYTSLMFPTVYLYSVYKVSLLFSAVFC